MAYAVEVSEGSEGLERAAVVECRGVAELWAYLRRRPSAKRPLSAERSRRPRGESPLNLRFSEVQEDWGFTIFWGYVVSIRVSYYLGGHISSVNRKIGTANGPEPYRDWPVRYTRVPWWGPNTWDTPKAIILHTSVKRNLPDALPRRFPSLWA